MSWDLGRMRLRAPVCLTWQVTDRCNLRCIHCLSGGASPSREELSMDEIKAFLDDLAEMKVFYINLGGGEPLLHPRFFDIVDEATRRGVYVQFSTNGTLVDPGVAVDIARRGLRVQVSLDGWQPSVHDRIRGAGSFVQALEALRYLQENQVAFSINCVMTAAAVAGLDDLLRLAKEYGAGLRLSRLRPSGRARARWAELAPGGEQYRLLYHWLKKHPEVHTGDSFFFLSPLGEPLPGLRFCGAGRLTCSVDPRGDVYSCPFTIEPALKVGNLRAKPLSGLWREPGAFHPLREALEPEGCRGCPAFSKCRGGCRGAAFLTSGSWDEPDPDCIRGEVCGQAST